MAKITSVKIGEKVYPCRETMGAALRFKRETGKDISSSTEDLESVITYLWCSIASACAADGVPFEMSLIEFADAAPMEDLIPILKGGSVETKKK